MAGIIASAAKRPQATTGSIAARIERRIDSIPDAVVQKLTDGAGDLELELADTAGNLVSAEIGNAKVDDTALLRLCAVVVASLMRYVVKAGLVDPNAVQQLGQRAAIMARQIAKTGPGSVE